MSARSTTATTLRLPTSLHDALHQRAEKLGRPTSEVMRDACAREVARPVDPRERSAVAMWLDGADLDAPAHEET